MQNASKNSSKRLSQDYQHASADSDLWRQVQNQKKMKRIEPKKKVMIQTPNQCKTLAFTEFIDADDKSPSPCNKALIMNNKAIKTENVTYSILVNQRRIDTENKKACDIDNVQLEEIEECIERVSGETDNESLKEKRGER